jgi:superfamily II DNA or RNA helicase
VDSLRQSLRVNAAPLLVAPTGAGKTVMFSHIAAGAAERGKRVMIVAHRIELLDQIGAALDRFGVERGFIAPKYTPLERALVQVAGVQALNARLKKRRYQCDLLIVDEAHHVLPTNSWGLVFEGLGRPKMIGVTASPVRSDGRGLGKQAGGLFDDLIDTVSVAELIAQGYLKRPVLYGAAQDLDLTGIRMSAGDFDKKELEEAVDKPRITGDAVEHYHQICPGATAVAFGVSIQHCTHIAEQFQRAGYRFDVIDGSMDDKRRRRLIKGLGKDLHGLVSCDLIGEGLDIPAIRCTIHLRATQSTGLCIQQMGRPLRPIYAQGFDLETVDGRLAAMAASGEGDAILLDHVGNWRRHGLPESEREWTLEGRKKKARSKKDDEPSIAVRQCEKCYAAYPAGPVCPHCGHVQTIADRGPEQVEGQLEPISPEVAEQMRLEKRREVGRAKSLEALESIERERGYKPGWAQSVWRAKTHKEQFKAEAQWRAYAR